MKRFLIVLCVLIFAVTSVAYANNATDYISEQGQSPVVCAMDEGQSRCDFRFIFTDVASIEWTDGNAVYQIKGHPERMAYIYFNMLPLESWDVCRYIIGSKARVSYGAKSNDICESVGEYAKEFEIAFTQRTAVYPSAHYEIEEVEIEEEMEETDTQYTQRYVLNTDTKVFHYPDCRDVDRMGSENRRDYTGTRDEIMNMGYKPCGHCNP